MSRTDSRIPPHNLEAEASAIGAALLSATAAESLVELVSPSDFYKPAHQHIAQAITSRVVAGEEKVDVVTVGEELRRGGLLDDAGGTAYLLALQNATPAITNAARYLDIVKRTARLRRLLYVSAEIAELAYTNDDPATANARALALLEAFGGDRATRPTFANTEIFTIERLRKLPPPTPLISGILDLDSLAVLYGTPGAGKSVAALDLALRVATGTRWHGHQEVHQGPVVYVAAEGAHGLPGRVDAWKLTNCRPHDPEELYVVPSAVNLFDQSQVTTFAAYIADVRPVLVIVDTLARCMIGADENSSKDMSTAVAALDELRLAAGSCVLIVHHSGKDMSAGARGHTALLGAADTMLKLGTTDGIVMLSQEKQKHHPNGNAQRFRLESAAGSVALVRYSSSNDDEVTGRTLDALAALAEVETPQGASFSLWVEAGDSRGISKASIARARAKALMVGLIEETAEGTAKNPRYRLTEGGRSQLPDRPEMAS